MAYSGKAARSVDELRRANAAINQRLEAQEDNYRDQGMDDAEIQERLAADKWNFQKEWGKWEPVPFMPRTKDISLKYFLGFMFSSFCGKEMRNSLLLHRFYSVIISLRLSTQKIWWWSVT